MIVLIRYFDGRLQGAIVLAAHRNTMRVALPLSGDCVEFRLEHGEWYSETNELVEIEFNAAESEADVSGCDRGGAWLPHRGASNLPITVT